MFLLLPSCKLTSTHGQELNHDTPVHKILDTWPKMQTPAYVSVRAQLGKQNLCQVDIIVIGGFNPGNELEGARRAEKETGKGEGTQRLVTVWKLYRP